MVLRSIDPQSLTRARQKARYHLFLSAAYDKNYIDIASDSLIKYALDYYSLHGSKSEKMLTWYYWGLIQKNAKSYPAAVVSLEKARQLAEKLNDMHTLGLINKNIASSFSMSNDIPHAIEYRKRAVSCFESNISDSLYYLYAQYSLAVEYANNKEYEQSKLVLEQLEHSNNPSILDLRNGLLAMIAIVYESDADKAISLYESLPRKRFSLLDCAYLAQAYEKKGRHNDADDWLSYGYEMTHNEAESATIDYLKSHILMRRGIMEDAYALLDHSTTIQDSLTRCILTESISTAQKDYFQAVSLRQEKELAIKQSLWLMLGTISLFTALAIIMLLINKSEKKDNTLKEIMAQQTINNLSIIRLSKENARLISTHYSERIRRIDELSKEYYNANDNKKKDIVFTQFKEYLSTIKNDRSFYSVIEEDLNHYCNSIMKSISKQIPQIQGRNYRMLMLFYAGLSYETILLITDAQSINSLKTLRSRLRKTIEESSAADKQMFLEMLEMT
jgi:tetratricopeptide (TPR) repeat protein